MPSQEITVINMKVQLHIIIYNTKFNQNPLTEMLG
jgi:hypothetical protein